MLSGVCRTKALSVFPLKMAYTDDKGTDECSWQPQLVLGGDQTASDDGGSVAGKGEL